MYGNTACNKEKNNYAFYDLYAPRVRIGDTVVIEYRESGETRTLRLLGHSGNGFEKDAITVSSPMGSAVFSKTVGRVLEVRTPVGVQTIRIVDIRKGA